MIPQRNISLLSNCLAAGGGMRIRSLRRSFKQLRVLLVVVRSNLQQRAWRRSSLQ